LPDTPALPPQFTTRVGQGYDVHRLIEGRPLVLGGVKFAHKLGLDGHSDADVLLHAIIDAMLGASALGDIGQHFPDSDPSHKDANSRHLLKSVGLMLDEAGWLIVNVDSTIIAQSPGLTEHIPTMVSNIAIDLRISTDQVNVKAKSNERLGYLGRNEAIEAQAIVMLQMHARANSDSTSRI